MPVVIKIDELERIREQISTDQNDELSVDDPRYRTRSQRGLTRNPLDGIRSEIPKIIHQIILPVEDSDQSQFLQSKEGWIDHHPSYIYVQWTANMIKIVVARYYPFFLRQYNSYSVSDQLEKVAPTLILHRYGGIYSHQDLIPDRDLSYLFNGTEDIYVIARKSTMDRFKLMASPSNSPFWSFFWIGGLVGTSKEESAEVPSIDSAIKEYNGTVGSIPEIHLYHTPCDSIEQYEESDRHKCSWTIKLLIVLLLIVLFIISVYILIRWTGLLNVSTDTIISLNSGNSVDEET
jgi:glycosyl transferase-like sugar-binding protein